LTESHFDLLGSLLDRFALSKSYGNSLVLNYTLFISAIFLMQKRAGRGSNDLH